MDLNFSVFQEPRGVMRILHFVFSIIALSTITEFEGYDEFICNGTTYHYQFEYPFNLNYNETFKCDYHNDPKSYEIQGDFSGDAKFFVGTCVLSLLYTIIIVIVYLKFSLMYKQNPRLPLIDFIATVILGVFWLSSSAAWANGLSGLKSVTTVTSFKNPCNCLISSSSFSSLNISVLLGFLNFFLWAADLWFLYKETSWFLENKFRSSNNGL